MKTSRNNAKRIFVAILLVLIASFLSSCGEGKSAEITSLEQLGEPGTVIGVALDCPEEDSLKEDYPNAEVIPYSDEKMAYIDVANGRIDAMVYERRPMELAILNGTKGVRLLDEDYTVTKVGVGISPVTPIPDFENKINTFIAELKADGTLQDMYDRWVLNGETEIPDIPAAENPEVNLRVGTVGTLEPYSYYIGDELRGFDIELAYRFASWLNASLEFKIYDFGALVPASESGDIDCIMADLYYTEERAEQVIYSDILFEVKKTAMVRSGDKAESSQDSQPMSAEYTEFSQLSGKTVSMLTGAPFESLVSEYAPDVGEYTFFNNTPDMILALKSGKTDAFLTNNAVGTLAINRNSDITLFPQSLQDGVFGIAFAKGDPDLPKWQEAYDSISEEEKKEVWEKWTGSDEGIKKLPDQDWPGEGGTIQAAVCDTLEPMSYMNSSGELVGFDLEMILLMAKKLDVHVEFTGIEFSAVLSSVQSGKAKIGAGSIIATDERRQSVDFIDYYPASFILVVRGTQSSAASAMKASDFETAKIGILTGANFADIVSEHLPDAECVYFNSTADELNALINDKVDALALDGPVARSMQAEDKSLAIVPEELGSFEYAFAIRKDEKGEALKRELDEYIIKLRDDGTLEELQKKWFDSSSISYVDMLDYSSLPEEKGVIRLATTEYPPFTFSVDGKQRGYEVEILAMFARDYGYALDITGMSIDGELPAVQSGKCDVACSSIAVTEERGEVLLFSEPDYVGGTALLTKNPDASAGAAGFIEGVKESFDKTFIRESRWKLFVSGILTTMLITILSIIFGTLLGFAVFMLCRNGNRIANSITNFMVWLVQGMPIVVLLMILYYIIFGKLTITGTTVSIIGFTLVFGSGVFNMIRSGVGAIDKGQTEAAYALGYPNNKAFFRVILPQAFPHIMPKYKGEITALIKATAIVGYVAVQDLTKMADIVRSRTYDAFFPLIAVAIIYFILAGILTFIVNRVEIHIDPRKRSKQDIIKGIKEE